MWDTGWRGAVHASKHLLKQALKLTDPSRAMTLRKQWLGGCFSKKTQMKGACDNHSWQHEAPKTNVGKEDTETAENGHQTWGARVAVLTLCNCGATGCL